MEMKVVNSQEAEVFRAEAYRIIKRWSDLTAPEREQATIRLKEMGWGDLEGLLRLLAYFKRRSCQLRRRFKVARYTFFTLILLAYYVGTGRFPGYGWAILAGILAAIVTDIMHFVFTIGFRRGMTEALSQYDDLRMIGPLLELHSAGSERKELEEERCDQHFRQKTAILVHRA